MPAYPFLTTLGGCHSAGLLVGKVVLPELRHGKIAGRVRLEMPRTIRPGQVLRPAFLLERDQRVEERLRPRRTAGDVHVYREVAVNASYEQIAEIMDCPVGTVRSRIFRAREAIDSRISHLVKRP